MSVLLTVLAAILTAGGLLFGILRISMWMTDKKADEARDAWKDSGYGNPDGYGKGFDDFGCGGDSGGGGGD
ncbi:MAG: hypothetical protein AAGL10_02820 [Pseudomonadota bacterium]